MKHINHLLLAWGLAAAMAVAPLQPALGQLPPLTADDPPLTAARQKEITDLIRKLGDAGWQKRQQATEAIQQIGEPALPFLEAALADPDAEIQLRAESLIKTIKPAVVFEDTAIISSPQGLRISGNFTSIGRLIFSSGPVAKIVISTVVRFPFKGRQFTITRTFDGATTSIQVEIAESASGREVVRTVQAASEEELERNEPEIFKICQKRAGDLAQRQAGLRAQYSQMTGIP